MITKHDRTHLKIGMLLRIGLAFDHPTRTFRIPNYRSAVRLSFDQIEDLNPWQLLDVLELQLLKNSEPGFDISSFRYYIQQWRRTRLHPTEQAPTFRERDGLLRKVDHFKQLNPLDCCIAADRLAVQEQSCVADAWVTYAKRGVQA